MRRGVTYEINGRRNEVPNGPDADAVSLDGRRWPVRCEAGDWVAPEVLPTVKPSPAVRPPPVALPGCGPQTVSLGALATYYGGPRVPEGGSTTLRVGLRVVALYCVDGKLQTERPGPVTPGAGEALRPR